MGTLFPATASAGLALLAAVSWGGGDFSGGMGVKAAGGTTRGALRVIVAGHALSLAAILVVLVVQHASVPHGAPMAWGLAAGVAAGLSLTAFYIALARGAMGVSAAISGLLAAAIPAVLSSFLEGAPGLSRLLGFALAAAAIWLIAAPPAGSPSTVSDRQTTALAIGGGIGFGVYFSALRLANPLGVLEPLALARVGSLVTCLVLLLLLRPAKNTAVALEKPSGFLSRTALLWAVGITVLDTGGNLFFIAATRAGRLDIAAVLASLYPASTILLAAWLLAEKPSRRQMVGMVIALAAVVMVTA